MSSTKNKTETKSKVETCCSEPAKRKLLIKIGIGVGVAAVLLVVIIAVAVVMATRSEDTGSNPNMPLQNADNASISGSTQSTPGTTVLPPSTTKGARMVTVAQSRISVNLPASLGGTKETLVSEEDSQTQWIYYDTDDYAIYIIQKFNEGTQTIVALTRGSDDLNNNYNGTILFCEESKIEGSFPTKSQIQESRPSQNITTQTNGQSFEAPSVILPLKTEKCSDLPDRLKYTPGMKTTADLLGPICIFLVSMDMSEMDTMASFSGDQCMGGSSLEGICGCYKQCLNCTLDASRPSKPAACQCSNYAKDALKSMSCSDDDGQCVKDRDAFSNHVQHMPCSCSFGVYFSYPCGVQPDGCQGSDCALKWCFHGFQYPVTFAKMCQNTVNAVQCTKT